MKSGQTEVITDNLNPIFVKSITVDYLFEEKQEIRIAVYDIDDFKPEANIEQNLIGTVELFVHDIIRAPGGKLIRPIQGLVMWIV